MKIYKFNDIDFMYSKDMVSDFKLDSNIAIEDRITRILQNMFEDNSEYEQIINLYAKENNLSKKLVISAHGLSEHLEFYLKDDNLNKKVNSIIKTYDGLYSLIALNVCNPSNLSLKSRKSPLLYYTNTHSKELQDLGECQIELYIPRIGVIDRNSIKEKNKVALNEYFQKISRNYSNSKLQLFKDEIKNGKFETDDYFKN